MNEDEELFDDDLITENIEIIDPLNGEQLDSGEDFFVCNDEYMGF